MKNSIKNTGITFLLFLYSFFMAMQPLHASDKADVKSDLQTKVSGGINTDASLQHIVPSAGTSVHQVASKIFFPVFGVAYTGAAPQIIHLQAHFNQYSFYSKKIIERFKNTDIIYPFHYFL